MTPLKQAKDELRKLGEDLSNYSSALTFLIAVMELSGLAVVIVGLVYLFTN